MFNKKKEMKSFSKNCILQFSEDSITNEEEKKKT